MRRKWGRLISICERPLAANMDNLNAGPPRTKDAGPDHLSSNHQFKASKVRFSNQE